MMDRKQNNKILTRCNKNNMAVLPLLSVACFCKDTPFGVVVRERSKAHEEINSCRYQNIKTNKQQR